VGIISKEKESEFFQYLDVSSNPGLPFLGRRKNATLKTGLCGLKFKQRKVTVKSSEIPTLTPK